MKLPILHILTGILSLNTVLSQIQPGVCGNGVQTRKNINSLSPDEVQRYFNAIKQLNSGPSGVWAKLTREHLRYKEEIHMANGVARPIFLMWHRVFLREMESKLQEIDPTLTIPYWDWSVNQSEERNRVFSEQLFGGAGVVENGKCITSGQFQDFIVYVVEGNEDVEQCITRKNFRSIEDSDVYSDNVLADEFLTKQTIREFKEIELPHGSPHNSVGGVMSTQGSPADPLFWSHHAFIDKLWFDWQHIHPEIAQEYGIPHNTPIGLGYDGVTIGDAVIVENLCYNYPEEHFLWNDRPLPNSVRLARSHTNIKVEQYNIPTGLTPEQVEKFDKEYVTKGTLEVPAKLRSKFQFRRIPNPLPTKFIKMMGWNVKDVREKERKLAKVQDSFNRARLGDTDFIRN